jgi:hypothetical protein
VCFGDVQDAERARIYIGRLFRYALTAYELCAEQVHDDDPGTPSDGPDSLGDKLVEPTSDGPGVI